MWTSKPSDPWSSRSQSFTASYGPLSSGSLPQLSPGPRDGSQEPGDRHRRGRSGFPVPETSCILLLRANHKGPSFLVHRPSVLPRKPWCGWGSVCLLEEMCWGDWWGICGMSFWGWVQGEWWRRFTVGDRGRGLWGERSLPGHWGGGGEWWGLCKVSDERVCGLSDRESVGWMMSFWVLGASWMYGSWRFHPLLLFFCMYVHQNFCNH